MSFNTQVVVFELQEGVAAQNMYEMFAQRDKALAAFFTSYQGVSMSEGDLVRNHLLGHIADDARGLRRVPACGGRAD